MKTEIVTALREILNEMGGRLLLAVESGSRAWGFASPDSDYDVRAVYVMPEEWYWRIDETPADSFTRMLPGDLDIGAWELRKALRLFARCNPSFNEWLGSPVIYYADADFLAALRGFVPDYFNPCRTIHHYLALARKAYGERDAAGSIRIKKLFYALRGLMAARWTAVRLSMPPTPFAEMLLPDVVPPEAVAEIRRLLEVKKTAAEGAAAVIPPALSRYWEDNCEELSARARTLTVPHRDPAPLSRLLREAVTAPR